MVIYIGKQTKKKYWDVKLKIRNMYSATIYENNPRFKKTTQFKKKKKVNDHRKRLWMTREDPGDVVEEGGE